MGVDQLKAVLVRALVTEFVRDLRQAPMKFRGTIIVQVAVLVWAGQAVAQNYPMLMSVKPVAAQVGQTSEHVVTARYNVGEAYRVLFSGAGVTAEIVRPDGKAKPNSTKARIRITVAKYAKPGVRDFRLATPQGISTVGQLVIAEDAVVSESAKNNSADQAEQITVPSTVCGAIESTEDVDFFKFRLDAATALSFHVRSQRLEDRIHDLQTHVDPILTLKNLNGSTLATSDNYFYGDPFLHFQFDQPGGVPT